MNFGGRPRAKHGNREGARLHIERLGVRPNIRITDKPTKAQSDRAEQASREHDAIAARGCFKCGGKALYRVYAPGTKDVVACRRHLDALKARSGWFRRTP